MFNFSALLALTYVSSFFNRYIRGLFIIATLLLLILLFAFRGEHVGTDTLNYILHYQYAVNDSTWFRSSIEPGWYYLNKLSSLLGMGYRGAFLITITLILSAIFFAARRFGVRVLLVLFFFIGLYYYFRSFNVTRQVLASSIVLLGLSYLYTDERPHKFLFSVFIASTFHASAIFAALWLFYKKLPQSIGHRIPLIAAAFVFGLFGTNLLLYLGSFTGYAKYFINYEFGTLMGNGAKALIYNSFFIVLLFIRNKDDKFSQFFFVYILIFNVLLRVPFGDRLLYYFSFFQMIFYAKVIEEYLQTKRKRELILSLLVTLFTIYSFFSTFGAGEILPYTNELLGI